MSETAAASYDPQFHHSTEDSPLVTLHSPRSTPHSLEREAVEFVVVGFSMAILLCGFIVQPYFVPSASMAPVLLGLHKDIHCPECNASFPIGVEEGGFADTDSVHCPHCGKGDISLQNTPISGGDQVLVWKGIYQLRPIRRWEMVVFVHPQTPRECYVKRAVGFPGEAIQIKHGDVYINGEIAAKSFEQLMAMAVPVGRIADFENPKPTSLHVLRWSDGKSYAISARGADGEPCAVRDLLSYNAGGDTWEREPIRDVIPSMTIGAEVELQFRGLSGTPIQVMVHQDELILVINGEPTRRAALPKNSARRLTFAYWDGRVSVRWNGLPLFEETPLPPTAVDKEPSSMVPLFVVTGFDRPPTNFELLRDVYYTERVGGSRGAGVDEPYKLGPKEYFMLGDNSAVSRDSRGWEHPGVSADLFVGKPMLVHWPLFAWRFPGTNRAIQLPALSKIRRLR
jgi:signal peptidase I